MHQGDRLAFIEVSRRLHAVGRINAGAPDLGSPCDGLHDVGDAPNRTIQARERVGGIHLGELHAVLFHFAPQQLGVLIHGHVRLIPQAVNPAHPIDKSALDIADSVARRPGKAFVEGPIRGVERIRMKADLHLEFPWLILSPRVDGVNNKLPGARTVAGTACLI